MVGLPFKRRFCPHVYAKNIAVYEIETVKLEPQKIFPNKNQIWITFNYYCF